MKEKILVATLELACEKGLGFVSMSQIAAKCGLSKSSLYSHYKSKEEIINKMYEFFRSKSFEQNNNLNIEELFEGRTFVEVLRLVVESYKIMNSDKYLSMFYKMIYSERRVNREAARILIAETNKMIASTKMLFKEAQSKGMVNFDDIEVSAMSFALCINQIMNYEIDLDFVGEKNTDLLEKYINNFAKIYGRN